MEESRTIPRTRAECPSGSCPYYECRHHLGLEVRGKRVIVHVEPEKLDVTRSMCALDLAARGGMTLDDVRGYFGVSRERIRQVEQKALAKLRRSAPELFEHLVAPGDVPLGESPKSRVEQKPKSERGTGRARVLDALRPHPEVAAILSVRAGVSLATFWKYAKELVEAGLAVKIPGEPRRGAQWRLASPNSQPEQDMKAAKMQRQADIADIIEQHPGAKCSEVQRRIGANITTVRRDLQSMVGEGVLRVEGEGSTESPFRYYYVGPSAPPPDPVADVAPEPDFQEDFAHAVLTGQARQEEAERLPDLYLDFGQTRHFVERDVRIRGTEADVHTAAALLSTFTEAGLGGVRRWLDSREGQR